MKSEKGQAMVEFALMLPLLVLIICAIIDFGWIFGNRLSEDNAAKEAARVCSINSSLSQSELEVLAQQTVESRAEVLCRLCPVNVIVTKSSSNGTVSIELSCELPVLTPLASTIFGDTFALDSVSVMRME